MSRFDYNDVNPDMTDMPSQWNFLTHIFRLYTTVTVLDKIEDWNKSAILKSYDLENFVGVGFKNGNPQKYVSSSSTEDVSGKNYIEWDITDNDLENHGLLFTYKGKQFWVKTYDNGTPIIKSFAMNSGGWKNNIYFWDSDKHDVSRITFTSKINLQANSGETRDPLESPFHVESGISNGTACCFLCFNTTELVNRVEIYGSNTKRLNGANWDCTIFIYDPENPYFNLKPEIKTLELPSIYKPFYMRALAVVDNNKIGDVYKTRVVGNIYNGIGVMSGDNKYVIGTLSASVNETNITYQITGSTPTLLGYYTDCVHSFTSLSGDNTERFEGSVTDLTDINLSLKLEEKVPEGNNTFLPNTLLYDNTVSFYSIKYRRSRQTDSVLTQDIQYYMKMESFQGNSNGNVAYYFVSPHFWKKFVTMTRTVTGGTEDITVDFNDIIKCNTEQKYELSPNTSNDENSDFLSLYDTFYFSSYREYMLWYVENFYFLPEFAENMPDPNDHSIVIRIDTDEVINGKFDNDEHEVNTVFTMHNKKNKVSKDWLIIGITDPLLNLIDSDLFNQEKMNGTILPPHKNFVSIMTIAQPTIKD